MSRTNFLIGRGQMLTAEIPPIRRGFADKESQCCPVKHP